MAKRTIEPTVTISQEPAVLTPIGKIEPPVIGGLDGVDQEREHRLAFAKRLNELLDDIGVPPKGNGRQVIVGQMFKVSQKGARKWLEGEALPDDHRIPDMAEKLQTTEEYLRWGRGSAHPADGHAIREVAIHGYSAHHRFGSDSLLIEQLNVAGGMSPDGRLAPEHVEVVHQVRVNVSELRRQVSFTSAQNLRVITGYGDSMKPTFSDGDPLIVDIGVHEVTLDAVYVIERENNTDRRDIFIKRIQRRPITDEWLMISDNTIYPPYLITKAEWPLFKVSARVLLAWNARRL